MREAIKGLMELASSRTMLILGDMAEMGDAADREHSELAHWIDSLPVDRVILAGSQFSRVCESSSRILVFREKEEVASYLESEPVSGFQILLKGSRIMEMESLAKYL
jgi:UDP-N-acetylmuramoyl-tripeptide--D-alanyl-D-alanine ligase